MKKFTLSLLGLIMMSFSTSVSAQATWIKVLELFNKLKENGATPNAITFIDNYNDTLTTGGWIHDSIYVYGNNGEIKKFYNVENLFQRINGTWQQLQNAPMHDPGAVLIAHPPPMYGIQYLSEEGIPHADVLNRTTNQFDSLTGINFNSGYFYYAPEMGNNEVLFLGNGPGSFSIIDGETYRFAVLYNTTTHTKRHTYCSAGEGLPSDIEAEFRSNDTIFIVGQNSSGNLALSGIKDGTQQWIENLYPTVFCTRVLKAIYVNGTTYAAIQDIDYHDHLYRFSNGAWQKIIDFTLNASASSDPFKGLAIYKGKIIVAGEFNQANGTATNGIIAFDEAKNTVSDIALPHAAGGIVSAHDCEGLYVIESTTDTTLYMPWYHGSYGVGLESQTLYRLQDSTVVAPPPNKPPIANAGTDQTITLPTNAVTLTGSGTDSDGTIVSYLWKNLSGGSAAITSVASATTTVTGLTTQGIYKFSLKVTDNDSATASDTVVVTVNPAIIVHNEPPTADAGHDQMITLPIDSVALIGSGTDPDGTIASYTWTKIFGSGTITTANMSTTEITNLTEGTSKFRLSVTDNGGATATDEVIITVAKATPVQDSVVFQHRIYPNPATDNVTIEQVRSVSIYTMNGQLMEAPSIKKVGVDIHFSVGNYPSGMYIIRATDLDKKIFTQKVEVVH